MLSCPSCEASIGSSLLHTSPSLCILAVRRGWAPYSALAAVKGEGVKDMHVRLMTGWPLGCQLVNWTVHTGWQERTLS